MRGGALKMQELTRVLPGGSTTAMVDGSRRSFADSGEHLRRGTAICRRLELSLLDSLLWDGIDSAAHHLGHSRDTGVLSVTLPK
jgi:hypothetical protein